MENVRIYTNEQYLRNPERNPRQHKRLEKLLGEIIHSGQKRAAEVVPVNFQPPEGTDIHDHVANQLFRDLRRMISSQIVTFFGDGGTGLFLAGMDQISSGHFEATGREIYEIREKPVIIGPGGSHMHGSKFLGTHKVSAVTDYLDGDADSKEQRVRIRQGTVTTVQAGNPEKIITQKHHLFYGFAGKEFDSHALMINEGLDRRAHPVTNEIKALRQLVRDVFFDKNEPQPKQSRLQAWTAMPRWWYAKFNPETNALGDPGMYMMESEIAADLDMMKIASVIAVLGAHSTVLDYFLRKADKVREARDVIDKFSIMGILDKFHPRYAENFTSEFDPTLIGGHCYSFDGTPHHVEYGPEEKAFMTISVVPGTGIKAVKLATS